MDESEEGWEQWGSPLSGGGGEAAWVGALSIHEPGTTATGGATAGMNVCKGMGVGKGQATYNNNTPTYNIPLGTNTHTQLAGSDYSPAYNPQERASTAPSWQVGSPHIPRAISNSGPNKVCNSLSLPPLGELPKTQGKAHNPKPEERRQCDGMASSVSTARVPEQRRRKEGMKVNPDPHQEMQTGETPGDREEEEDKGRRQRHYGRDAAGHESHKREEDAAEDSPHHLSAPRG